MSTHKHIDKICLVAALLAVVLCAVFINGEAFGVQAASKVMGYETRLFDTSQVHTIDIVMDEWDSFIETCENEEYAACSVVIDGEAYGNVGIRAKGNTSLSTVSAMNSDRYSFKIEFDQYDSTKSYHGLDKLGLNNLIQDSTMMKDYLTYQLMGEFGAAAPLCSYVYITVNGEDWGLYLAVEGVEDAFLQRNYGKDYGELYKPDSMNFGGGGPGNGRDFNMEDFMEANPEEFSWQTAEQDNETSGMPQGAPDFENGFMPQMGQMPFEGGFPFEGNFPQMPDGFTPPDMPGSGSPGGGFGMGSSDVKLQYVDDDPDSYSAIFSSAKTDITEVDQKRLIKSLKALGTGEDIETVVNIDQVLRYFVVHNFVVNGDSYTGSMIHNYYLYEEDGLLSMIPWDYNLAFGTFMGGSANSTVNDPIDTPLSVSGSGDRPMADWIFGREEYTQMYHQYFAEFLDTTDFAAIIDETAKLIVPYIEKDPTKFYTAEECETSVAAIREFCLLREESILGQLNGTIPATDAGQSADPSALVDASHITLSDMGSMGGGKGGGFPGGKPGDERNQGKKMTGGNAEEPAIEIIPMPDMEAPETTPDIVTPDRPEGTEAMPERGRNDRFPNGNMMPQDLGDRMPMDSGSNRPMPDGVNSTGATIQSPSTMPLLAVSVLVLLMGLFVAKKYRR